MAAEESLQLTEGQVDNQSSVADSTELTNCGKKGCFIYPNFSRETSFAKFDKPHGHK